MPTPQQRNPAPARRTNTAGTIADVKLGHIVAALGRYRPVLAVVGVVLLLALVLEGPALVGESNRFATPNPASRVQTGAPPTTTTTAQPADSFTPPAPRGGAGETAAAAPARSATPSATPASSYTPPRSSSGGSSTGGSRSFDEQPDAPLTIAAAAWASRTAGTPVADAGVPADSLPVGMRVGQDDKRSFIRLTGDEFSLTLVPVDEEGANRSPEEAVIQACQISEGGWEEGEAISFDDAPPYDPEDCVDGVRAENGTWTFSLITYPQRDDDRGFALVPGPDAPIDFQVAFSRTPTQ